MIQNRVQWIDAAKGIGIFLVVYGHSMAPQNHYVYLFHMPLFFIISGYLFNSRNTWKQFCWRKFITLYIPFVGWNAVVILTRIMSGIIRGDMEMSMVVQHLRILGYTVLTFEKDGSYMGATWFLGALFLISVLYKTLYTYLKDTKYKQEFILVFFIVNAIIVFFIDLPRFQSRTFILGMFFAFGHWVKLHEKELHTFNNILVAFWSVVIFLVIGNNVSANMGQNEYTNRILFVIGACAGTYVTVYVAMFLSRCRGKIWQILCKILCFLGKNSIDIVIWQFVSFRLCVLLQLYLEGRPLRDVLTCDSRYYTDHGWWLLYLAIGIIVPLAWGWFLKQGPWGKALKKIHFVA